MTRLFIIACLLLTSCASGLPITKRSPDHGPLARFMREMVNVPYSVALLANHRPGREARVHRAAVVLQDAVEDLSHWDNPPGGSEAARAVFFAYAQNLEHHVVQLQVASRSQDAELANRSLEGIRQTCNQCHRFFRPANRISADVALDLHAFDKGGRP